MGDTMVALRACTIARLSWLMVFTVLALPLAAQDSSGSGGGGDIELSRAQIQAERQAIINRAMELTDSESTTFWPLYREFRTKMAQVTDRQGAGIKEDAATANSRTDAQADKLMSNYMDFQKDKLNLEKDYVKKFKKILPTRKVARYFQLEHKLDAVIDYDLARAIPLLEWEPPSGRAPAQADIEQAGETLAVPFSPEALVEVAGWIAGEGLLFRLDGRDCRA